MVHVGGGGGACITEPTRASHSASRSQPLGTGHVTESLDTCRKYGSLATFRGSSRGCCMVSMAVLLESLFGQAIGTVCTQNEPKFIDIRKDICSLKYSFQKVNEYSRVPAVSLIRTIESNTTVYYFKSVMAKWFNCKHFFRHFKLCILALN